MFLALVQHPKRGVTMHLCACIYVYIILSFSPSSNVGILTHLFYIPTEIPPPNIKESNFISSRYGHIW